MNNTGEKAVKTGDKSKVNFFSKLSTKLSFLTFAAVFFPVILVIFFSLRTATST